MFVTPGLNEPELRVGQDYEWYALGDALGERRMSEESGKIMNGIRSEMRSEMRSESAGKNQASMCLRA